MTRKPTPVRKKPVSRTTVERAVPTAQRATGEPLRRRRADSELLRTKEQLAAANAWQRTMLDSAAVSVIATDPVGVIQTFNRAAERMLGHRARDVVGKATPAIIHDPDEVQRRATDLSRELGRVIEPGFEVFVAKARAGAPEEREWTYLHKNGRRIPVRLTVTAMHDVAGKLTGFMGVATDITERKRAEEERDRLFNYSLDMYCIAGFDGFFKQLNPAWAKTLGWTNDELLAQPYMEFVHPEDRASTTQAASTLVDGKLIFSFDNRYLAKDGSYKWISWVSYPLADEQLIFAVARDITERKRGEEALRGAHDALEGRVRERTAELVTANESLRGEIAQRHRAEALLKGEQEVLGMIAADRPLSETLEALAGHIEAKMTGLLCSILLLDADGIHLRHGAAPSLPEAYNKAIDGLAIGPTAGSCGTAAFLRKPVTVTDIASDPLWADFKDLALGHELRACWSTPILGADARMLGTFAIYARTQRSPTDQERSAIGRATNLARVALERQQADDALRNSDQRIRLATEASEVGIWEWNVITNKIRWDARMFRIYGLAPTPEGFVDYTAWSASVLPEELRQQEEALQDTVRRLGRGTREFRIRRNDTGECRYVQSVEAVRANANGQAEWVVGTNLDITDRRLSEAALQKAHDELEVRVLERTSQLAAKNAELKAFAYTVSHDLKAPLRGIAGYAQELERRHRAGLDERAQFCIGQIGTATRNLDHLIEDLLTYSRLDAETPSMSAVDLSGLVAAILKDRSLAIADHHAELAVEIPGATTLRTWERGLLQILANLIDNALKYSGKATPPRIGILAKDLGDTWEIAVSDNGIGFDMKYHDRIFGLFNRLVRAEDFEGTGAGLAIVKKLVDKLGGTIRAVSQPGAGATFFVRLPPVSRQVPAP